MNYLFTGIIEEKGIIRSMEQLSKYAMSLTVNAEKILMDMEVGDSIAVNGTCLTVTSFDNKSFSAEVMPETVTSTSLRTLKTGSAVNLERAMAANRRFGGHFVTGHVDGTGKIVGKYYKENAIYYDIELNKALERYVLKKGSIAVDGVSLTIFHVQGNVFTISLIPHTASATILGKKDKGDLVNIECDVLARQVDRLISYSTKSQELDEDFLKNTGF